MTDERNDELVEAFVAAVGRCAAAFERIAEALEAPPAVTVAPPAETPTKCQHPEKARVIFGADDEWECGAVVHGTRCGFRSPALAAGG